MALATGATVDVRLEPGPWVPVSNDPGITARFTDYVRSRPGAAFEDAPVTMASEDYGYILSRKARCSGSAQATATASLGKVLSR